MVSIRLHELIIGVAVFLFLSLPLHGSAFAGSTVDSKQVPRMLVSFGPNQGTPYAVVVEKKSQTLFLFTYGDNVREVLRIPCSTGEVEGAKTKSGDSKTPEGVYFFTKEHPKRDLSPIYGSRAFPMDYPNILDRLGSRDGNSIWMHGTNKPLKPRDSNGCIVLKNRNIDALAGYILLNRTPIIVVERLSYASIDSMIVAEKAIRRFLKDWNETLQTGTYHRYLMSYDPDYFPDIAWWPDWNRLNKINKASDTVLSIALDHISIFRHEGVFVVLFDQNISSSNGAKAIGTRKLFLKDTGKGLRIVGDEYQKPPEAERKPHAEYPLIAAYRKLGIGPPSESEIEGMIKGWLKAWSAKDIQQYGDFYAKAFRSQGMNRKSWLRHKDRLNKKYAYIQVSMKNLVIQKGEDKSIATFQQTYKSPGHQAVGNKRLVVVRENGQWKIFRETWKRQ